MYFSLSAFELTFMTLLEPVILNNQYIRKSCCDAEKQENILNFYSEENIIQENKILPKYGKKFVLPESILP